MKILLVEDDEAIARLLSETLSADNYTVDVAADGETGWELIERWEYDILALDIEVPGLDGLSLCRRVRQKGYRMSILMLTARDSNEAIITGLDAGADDYITKPFNLSLLLARVRVLSRRGYPPLAVLSLTRGALSLNTVSRAVTYHDREIELRRKEYQLLELFLRHPERVFSRDAILDLIWTNEDAPTEGAVTNLIKDLRQRLKKAGIKEEIIETVYGSGYRMKKASPKPSEKTLEAIEQASELFRTSLPERIKELETVEREARAGILTAAARQGGKEVAHKLVGGLGTFGLPDGTSVARRIETLLSGEVPLSPEEITELAGRLTELKAIVATVSPSLSVPEIPPDETKATALILGDRSPEMTPVLELLKPWGIHVVSLEERRGLPELLATIAPDILLLDAECPDLDPIAFCQSLRQHRRWGDLPVLVLTKRCDQDYLQALFASGADDFIAKPVLGPELVSRAVNHVKRMRLRPRESRSEIDFLTELVDRRSFDRQLPLFWARRLREKSPLSLLICEIDDLSRYNRQNGRGLGDTCLRRIAKELEHHAAPGRELLARYGGASFALLLPETPVDGAIGMAETIVQAIASLDISPAVTVSVGITATIPTPERTIADFLTAAEQALYSARWRGGNTYCLYPL
jgi:diguanylate cyclase (GGDEF)-like protein